MRRWAYLISLALPPFGLIFAYKFYKSETKDGLDNAMICVVLTCVSLVLYGLIVNSMLQNPVFAPPQEVIDTGPAGDIDYDPSSY
jgi:hypothetical protein